MLLIKSGSLAIRPRKLASRMAVTLDGEEEAPGNKALPSRSRGHKTNKTNLKRDASTFALSETLNTIMAEKEEEEAIVNSEENRRREKLATCATFIDLTKKVVHV
jgi:hypothetical protein